MLAVQTKGVGLLFHASRNAAIASSRSCTLRKDPRRTDFWVSSPNHRSIRFNQLELVGMKCRTKRGWRASHSRTFRCPWVP